MKQWFLIIPKIIGDLCFLSGFVSSGGVMWYLPYFPGLVISRAAIAVRFHFDIYRNHIIFEDVKQKFRSEGLSSRFL